MEPDDILKSLEEESEELEELLKANDDYDDDDDYEDDEDYDEDYEDDEDEGEEMGKSLELYEDEEEEDVYIDAAPILDKSMKVQEANIVIAKENNELLKSLAKNMLILSKAMIGFIKTPEGELPGANPPSQQTIANLNKSRELNTGSQNYHGYTFKQAKQLLLKSIQDGKLSRNAISVFEQGGILLPEAEAELIAHKGGNQ